MNNKLTQLEAILKETEKQEFNIVEDLKRLDIYLGSLKQKEFRKMLETLISKYENDELTEVRAALLSKCRAGDVQAIRLYAEHFKPVVITEEDDGLIDALQAAGKEAFADEV